MQPILLLSTTGQLQIDAILRGVIGVFEAAFPGRVGSCYLAGSYADASAVPLSDIDIRVVFYPLSSILYPRFSFHIKVKL